MNETTNNQHTNNNDAQNFRLNGAGKKRCHYLLRRGVPKQEARLLARNPINPRTRNSVSSTPARRQRQPPATAPAGSTQPSQRLPVQARLGAPVSRVATVPVEQPPPPLAILPGDYPSELWSVPQLEAVQQSIIDLIRRQEVDTDIKPKFSGCSFRQGWLSVSCNDIYTSNWLRSMDTRLRPWEGASLQVIPESEVPFKRVFVGIFPSLPTSSVKYALRLIDEQNEGLSVPDWRMIYRGQTGPRMKLIISIDSHSAEMLRKRDYLLNYGFSSVRFRPMDMVK